jgi:hypothetical protein
MVKAVSKPDILEPADIQRIFGQGQCIITPGMTWQPVTPGNLDMNYF